MSWPTYLRHGVVLLNSRLSYPVKERSPQLEDINEIFEQCVMQENNLSVQVEAYFRRAQAAHSSFDRAGTERWRKLGHERVEVLGDELPVDIRAYCLVLESAVFADLGQHPNALAALIRAWRLAEGREDYQRCADIAQRLGRLHTAHGTECGYDVPTTLRQARHWFRIAVEQLELIWGEPTRGTLSALALVSGEVGVAYQRCDGYRSPEAARYFAQAEHLLERVCDESQQAAYWFSRAKAALRSFRPQALWFFCRGWRRRISYRQQWRW